MCVQGFWIGLVALSALSYAICLYCKYVLHLHYPYSWPLFVQDDRFSDLLVYQERFRHFHQSSFFTIAGHTFNQTAPGAILFELFFLTPHPLRIYLAVTILFTALVAVAFARALRTLGLKTWIAFAFTATVVLFSYPLEFMIDRANIEVVVWMLLVVGIWLYGEERGWLSATCFGIAASVKFYPLIYLGLFMRGKKYALVIYGVLVFVAVTGLSMLALGPNFRAAWTGVTNGLREFKHEYALQPKVSEIRFNHSLFTLPTRILWHHDPKFASDLKTALTIYMAIVAASGILLFIFYIRNLPLINQVLALTIAAILFPPYSGDYTLVHLYIPWAMLTIYAIKTSKQKHCAPGLWIAYGCLAIIFTPQSYFIHNDAGFGGQVKALVLLLLFAVALKYRFGDRESAVASDSRSSAD